MAISHHEFAEPFTAGTGVVYLARGDVFADALAGGVLTDGPILLVRSCGTVPAVVTTEVRRLDPAKVVALGGPASVCETVLDTVAEGRDSARIAGDNRYETAALIAQAAFPTGPVAEAYIASGGDVPDAMAGGSLTAGPILLVNPNGTVPAVVRDQIERLDPATVFSLGGTSTIPDATLQLAAGGRDTDRLAGDDRYATAVAIATHAYPRNTPTAYLSNGAVFADAVAGGVLTDGPVLLVRDNCGNLPTAVTDYLTDAAPSAVIALGGTNSVCEANLQAAADAIPTPETPVFLDPDTQVLTPDELAQVTAYDPATGMITFTDGPPSLATISAGDIVIADYTETVPTGFLRQVEAVTITDHGLTLTTTEATLDGAIEHTTGLVGGEPVLLASYVEPAEGVEIIDGLIPTSDQVHRPDSLSPDAVEVKLEHTLKITRELSATTGDEDSNFTGSGKLNLDSTVKVGGTVVTHVDIEWFHLKELLFKATPTAEATSEVTLTGELQGTADIPIGKITRYWNVQIGPVPVVLVETTGLNVHGEVTTSGAIGFTAAVEAQSSVGIHYKDGEVTGILTPTASILPPTLTANADVTAEVELSIGPQVDLRAYGVVGLKAMAGPYMRATGTMTETDELSCRLEVGLKSELAAVAGIVILGLRVAMEQGLERTFALYDDELCLDDDPDPDPDPAHLTITTTSLPDAHLMEPYEAQLIASGGTTPYTWTQTGGSLPIGITLSSSGQLSGIPTGDGYYEPSFTVIDSAGTSASVSLPLSVVIGDMPGGTPVTSISAGQDHTCAVTTEGAVKCWGQAWRGKLGNGTTEGQEPSPVDVFGLGSGTTTAVSAGDHHTCAITVAGALKCWGSNEQGQIGDGSTIDRSIPVNVAGLGPGSTVGVSAGSFHSCVITIEAATKCWGQGYWDDSGTWSPPTPVEVVGLGPGTTAALATELNTTCVLTPAGAVRCRGSAAESPVEVAGLGPGTTTSITVGQSHMCAVTTENGAKCWGWNYFGQLGDGTDTNRPTPTEVVGLGPGTTISIKATYGSTCAITVSGAAKCWGLNSHGQLGDGTTANSPVPVDVVGLGTGTTLAISPRDWHSCAITLAGAAKCWGWNRVGQLGDGTTVDRLTPVNVLMLHP